MINKSNSNLKLLVIILLTWSLLPLLWQIYTSFSSEEALTNPLQVSTNRWTLDNYILLFQGSPPIWRYLVNSFIVGITTTITTILISIPASYVLAKLPNKSSYPIKAVLTATALFPYVLLFLALLELARTLHLGNNLFALSLPYTGLSLPLAILLLSSAFKDLPDDLEDAARIEGLDLIQRLKWVLVPLISPATFSTAILVFLFSWNEYPIALTWISKENLLTLPVAMARIAGSSIYSVPYGAYAAATVVGSLPLLILVLIFQRQIVSGLTQGAIKG